MRILVIGGTGNFGKFILEKLHLDPKIKSLVSFSRNKPDSVVENVTYVYGDCNAKEDFDKVLSGYQPDVVIHIPNLLLAQMENILSSCEEHGVQQIIVVGSAAMFTNLEAPTKEIRLEKEQVIRNSSIYHTILRPNMVYGHKNDMNIYKLLLFLRKYHVLVVPGSSKILQNPTHIEDFTQALINSLLNPKAYNKSYNLVGKSPVSLKDMAKILMAGKKFFLVEFPLSVGLVTLKALRFFRLAKWHPEKLLRLNEQKVLESTPDAFADLDYTPRSFNEGVNSYFCR